VITTLPVEEGAVKVTGEPLAELAALKLDAAQVGVGAQLQFTPPLIESLFTVATMLAVPLGASDVGGGVDKVTLMAGVVVMLTALRLLLMPELSDRVAVMTTLAVVEGAV
jgi:hypothetical protein